LKAHILKTLAVTKLEVTVEPQMHSVHMFVIEVAVIDSRDYFEEFQKMWFFEVTFFEFLKKQLGENVMTFLCLNSEEHFAKIM